MSTDQKPRLLYVADNGSDLDGDGSPTNPWQTPQCAYMWAGPDDIIFQNGIYNWPDSKVRRTPVLGIILAAVFLWGYLALTVEAFTRNPALGCLLVVVPAVLAVVVFDGPSKR